MMKDVSRVCAVLAPLLLLVVGVLSAPGAYHDQRQTGALNVRTQLDNFIVVLIPTSSLSSQSWLNFAKRFSLQDHLKHVREDKQPFQEKSSQVKEEEVLRPVILDKTPYTVDVQIKPKMRSPLARLHPSPVVDISSDVMIALSPAVSLSRNAGDVAESQRRFDQTPHRVTPPAPEMAEDATPEVPVPQPPPAPEKGDGEVPQAPEMATEAALRPPEVRPLEEPARMVKRPKSILSTTLERVEKVVPEREQRLRLLGAALEVCAPNERRGEDGNCEPIKARRRSGEFFAPSGLLHSLRFGLSPAYEK